MSNVELPAIVDPFKFTDQGVTLSGSVKASSLGRVAALLWDSGLTSGDVMVQLQFLKDDEYRRVISGQLQATLEVQCQRCLGPMAVDVQSAFELAVVLNDEQAALLPKRLDPVMVEGTELNVHAVVEEELLLSLPTYPLHEPGACSAEQPESGEAVAAQPERENPFAVLAGWKKH